MVTSEGAGNQDEQARGWWRARPRPEPPSADLPLRRADPAPDCVICSTLGSHSGVHYNAQQLLGRFHVLRVTDPGKKWLVLPDVRGPSEHPVLASLVDLGLPKSHFVAGCWLCEQTPDVDLDAAQAAAEAAAWSRQVEAQSLAEADAGTAPAPGFPETTSYRDGALKAAAAPGSIWGRLADPGGAAATGPEGGDGSAREPAAGGPPTDAGPATLEEATMLATQVNGYVRWGQGGLSAEVRSSEADGRGPAIEDLKNALRTLDPPAQVDVALTETLGRGESWVSARTTAGNQGKLLICLGQIVELLVGAGAYAEVTLGGDGVS